MRHTDVEGRTMKTLLVLSVVLLAGCTMSPTLEQLETQAFLSGDWSAVEKRERALLRRKMRTSVQCPAGHVAVCEGVMRMENCGCMKNSAVRNMLAGR